MVGGFVKGIREGSVTNLIAVAFARQKPMHETAALFKLRSCLIASNHLCVNRQKLGNGLVCRKHL